MSAGATATRASPARYHSEIALDTAPNASSAAATSARFRRAVESQDVDSFMATLANDVVLRSPITMLTEIRGHAEVRELMACVFASIEGIRYFDDIGDESARALFYRARVGSQPVEEATLLRFDDNAKVREITLWFRPLPGLAALTAVLGPKLVRTRGGAGRGRLAAALTRPLAPLTRVGDRLAVRLLGR